MNLYCVRALFAASLTALCAPEAATAQASASAQVTDSLSCIVGPGSATPVDLANGGVTADIGSTGLGCTATAGGYSYAGVMGAFAEASVAFDNTSSGGLGGESNASWSDSLHVVWPSGLAVAGVSTLRISFNLDADGGVAATRSDAEGFNLALGSAGIDYTFSFAGSVFSGSQSMAAGEAQ